MANKVIKNVTMQLSGLPFDLSVQKGKHHDRFVSGMIAVNKGGGSEEESKDYNVTITAKNAYGEVSENINFKVLPRGNHYPIYKDGVLIGSATIRELRHKIKNETIIEEFGYGAELMIPVHDVYGTPVGSTYEMPFLFGTVKDWETADGRIVKGLGLVAKNGALPARNYGPTDQWSTSYIRDYLNNDFPNCLPWDFTREIKPIKIKYGDFNTLINTTIDSFFILSLDEICPNGSILWDYYRINFPEVKSIPARAYRSLLNNTAVQTWTTSDYHGWDAYAYAGNGYDIASLWADGGWSYHVSAHSSRSQNAFAPACVLLSL